MQIECKASSIDFGYFYGYTLVMGRKPKKPADKKSNCLRVMLTEKDRAAIDRAAAANEMDTSTFVRTRILELIRKKS